MIMLENASNKLYITWRRCATSEILVCVFSLTTLTRFFVLILITLNTEVKCKHKTTEYTSCEGFSTEIAEIVRLKCLFVHHLNVFE